MAERTKATVLKTVSRVSEHQTVWRHLCRYEPYLSEATMRLSQLPSADHPVQVPTVGDALQLVLAGVLKDEA